MRTPHPKHQEPWQPCDAVDWNCTSAKRLYDILLGKMLQPAPIRSSDVEVPYLKALHVHWSGVSLSELPTMYASSEEIEINKVKCGDLLVCEGGEVGRAATISEEPPPNCIIQNALHRVKSQAGNDVRFLCYILRHAADHGWFDVLCNRATIAHFTGEKFGEMQVCYPSITEQRAIADYLDHETARIDALIAAKERLLELLAEKRRALITRAVTWGLDPDVPMRDSGIPWLGEIPAHWEKAQLRRFLAFITSGSRGWAEYYSDTGAIFLRIGNLTRDSIRLDLSDIQNVDPPESAEGNRTRVQLEDLLFSITAYLGSVAIVSEDIGEAYVNQHIALARLKENCGLVADYIAYAAVSDLGQIQLVAQSYGGTKTQLALDDIRELWFPIPPKNEQVAIVEALCQMTSKFERIKTAVEQAITLLKERRAALISAAVTGQIDVGGTA